MEMVAATVPWMTLQRVSLFLLVRKEFRLEIYTKTIKKIIITNNIIRISPLGIRNTRLKDKRVGA